MADETFPHLDGSARDEEVALAQWQRKRIDDLQAANAHLEEQLELERQRNERLMADRHAGHIPYEVVEDDRGPRVLRGPDVIGWAFSLRNAESFARELNALQSRLARREAVAKAARAFVAATEQESGYVRVMAMHALRAALEAADGE